MPTLTESLVSAPETVILYLLLWGPLIIGLALLIIPEDESDTPAVRAFQSFKLRRTLFAKVLSRAGIDLDGFVRSHSASELKHYSTLCYSCPHTKTCDQTLRHTMLLPEDFDSCPNRETLRVLLKPECKKSGSTLLISE